MRFRPRQQAQSAVRAINELVGEATERIEDVLPTIRHKKSGHRKQKFFGAVAVAAVTGFVATRLLGRGRRTATPEAAVPVTSRTAPDARVAGNGEATASERDELKQPSTLP
jgi:hypothetical protein